MPRGPRLDAPDTLHHVMVRGIERAVIFRDDPDRADFLARVALLVEAGAWTVYAWALLQNHLHLLVRTGTRPLAHSMRSLLTGYTGVFNRRHKRVGHLCQNRYKSILVEEEPYLLELVRYLHLNPLRAKVVPTLRRLDRLPLDGPQCSHGRGSTPLAGDGNDPRPVRPDRAPGAGGLPRLCGSRRAPGAAPRVAGRGPRPEFGGLGCPGSPAAGEGRRRRGCPGAGKRRVRRATAARDPGSQAPHPTQARLSLETVMAWVCRETGTTTAELAGDGQRAAVTRAREGIAHLWVGALGQSGRRLAPMLGVAPQSVYRAAARGAAQAAEWPRSSEGDKSGSAPYYTATKRPGPLLFAGRSNTP
jgi:putative transposase